MGFSRQEYWNGLPFSSAGDLPDPGIKPVSLMSLLCGAQAGSLPLGPIYFSPNVWYLYKYNPILKVNYKGSLGN